MIGESGKNVLKDAILRGENLNELLEKLSALGPFDREEADKLIAQGNETKRTFVPRPLHDDDCAALPGAQAPQVTRVPAPEAYNPFEKAQPAKHADWWEDFEEEDTRSAKSAAPPAQPVDPPAPQQTAAEETKEEDTGNPKPGSADVQEGEELLSFFAPPTKVGEEVGAGSPFVQREQQEETKTGVETPSSPTGPPQPLGSPKYIPPTHLHTEPQKIEGSLHVRTSTLVYKKWKERYAVLQTHRIVVYASGSDRHSVCSHVPHCRSR